MTPTKRQDTTFLLRPVERFCGNLLQEKWSLVLLVVLVVAIGSYIYRDYLCFKKVFVFSGFASDTIRQFYPEYFFRAERVFSGNFSMWSFQFDLGTNIYTTLVNFNPFDLLLLAFGKAKFVYAIVYIVFLKHLVAAVFFFMFLSRLKYRFEVAIIGALAFSFSGYMVVYGHWYHYQNYAVFAALMLFLFEYWFQTGRWLLLVIALGLLQLKGILQLYQIIIFLSIYAFIRMIMERGFQLREIVHFYLKFGLMCLAGVGLSAFVSLPDFLQASGSTRGSDALQQFNLVKYFSDMIRLTDASRLETLILRFFSNDILGSFERFRGPGNYLESPASYVGLMIPMTLPIALAGVDLRKKCGLLLILMACTAYAVFPYIHELGNAFASGTHKYTIMYFSIMVILLGCQGIENVFSGKIGPRQFLFLFIWMLFFAVVLIYARSVNKWPIRVDVYHRVLFFIAAYIGVIFLFLPSGHFRQCAALGLVMLVAFELAVFAGITTGSSSGVMKAGFEGRNKSYFDKDTFQALDFIRRLDKEVYRIEKSYFSEYLNDAWVQRYFGTTAYLGFTAPSIVEFYRVLGLSKNSPRLSSYRFGLEDRAFLYCLLGVKYYLADGEAGVPHRIFKPLKVFGRIRLYKNMYSLPLSVAYTHFISNEEFAILNKEEKDRLLLKGCVVFSQQLKHLGIQRLDLKSIRWKNDSLGSDIEKLRYRSLHIKSFSEDHIAGELDLDQNAVLFFSVPYDAGWRAQVDGQSKDLIKVNIGFLGLPVTRGFHSISLHYSPPGVVAGIVASLVILLLVLLVYKKRPHIASFTSYPEDANQ